MLVPIGSINDTRSCGLGAWLVTPAEGVAPRDLAAGIRRTLGATARDVVPGAATVLVVAARAGDDLAARLAVVAPTDDAGGPADVVEIDVVYDGPDLDAVAAASGLTPDGVIARHVAASYRCDFCGFAPGFAYLSGLDPVLQRPRRATPRTRVPAGSVAIADRYSAVYPTECPGGWHLLGRTATAVWDPRRPHPALIAPGTVVRFRPVTSLPELAGADSGPPTPVEDAGRTGPAVVVVTPGWSTSLQDAGRPGFAHLGVGAAGALDPAARALVNRLVGNDERAAGFETAGGLVIEAVRAVTVADSASATVRALQPGERIALDPPPGRSWAYLAVRGGIAAEMVLGSRSWDSLGRVGPAPPSAGTAYRVGADPRTPIVADQAPVVAVNVTAARVPLRPGPRADWFAAAAVERLLGARWTISAERSRVGVRLDGPPLPRAEGRQRAELPSEGIVTGAVQVPPDGRPIVLLADHPTTGGYPVIAVVAADALAVVAQSPPGTTVRFTATG